MSISSVGNQLEQLFFSSKKRFLGTLAGLVLLLSIPVTMSLVYQQQDIRQRADTLSCAAFNNRFDIYTCGANNQVCRESATDCRVKCDACVNGGICQPDPLGPAGWKAKCVSSTPIATAAPTAAPTTPPGTTITPIATTAPGALICTVSPNPANSGNAVEYIAIGGNGTYAWNPPGYSPNPNILYFSYGFDPSLSPRSQSVTSGGVTQPCPTLIINGAAATAIPTIPGTTVTATPTTGATGTPTATPTLGAGINLGFSVTLPGIGSSSTLGLNTNPIRPVSFTVQVINSSGTSTPLTAMVFPFSGGLFTGTVNAPSLTPGLYAVKIKSDNSLYKATSTSPIQLNPGLVTITPVTLVTGNVNDTGESLNKIGLQDYSDLISCYNGAACSTALKQAADLNLDNTVDSKDVNILLRAYGTQGD